MRFPSTRCQRCWTILLVAGLIACAALLGASVAQAQAADPTTPLPLPEGVGQGGLWAVMITAMGYMAKRLSECVSPAEVSRLNGEIARAQDTIERTREQRDDWMRRALEAEARLRSFSPPTSS